MKSIGIFFRTAFLAIFSLSLVGGSIATDYFFRHEEARKALRFLARQNIDVSVGSAIDLAAKGDVENLKLIELAGQDLGQADEKGVTPLLSALRADKSDLYDFFLLRDSVVGNVNQATVPEQDSAMAHTLRERNFPVAKRLLTVGAKLNVEKYPGLPFLIDAVEQGDKEMVDFLLKNKIDVNSRGTQPYSAAALVTAKDDFPLLERLANVGADLDVIGKTGSPLLIEAVEQQNNERIEFLLKNGADVKAEAETPDKKGWTAVSVAVAQRDDSMMKTLFAAGADPDSIGIGGGALLYEAVNEGDMDLVKDLLNYGASADSKGENGETSLARAVGVDDLDLVQTLLGGGANPGDSVKEADPPLLVSIGNGNVAIAKLLIEAGAKLDGQTMLAKAYENRDDPLLNLLLNAGADAETTLPGSDTRIFDLAVKDGATSAVRTLLNAGAKIGDNLWAALLTKQDDIVQVILSGGADPGQKGLNGEDPLDFVLRKQQYKAARFLLAAGADANANYDEGETWLAKSVRDNNPEIAGALITAGANVKEVKTRDGHTLLGWSIANEMSDVGVALINAGVDVMAYEKSSAASDFRDQFESSSFRGYLRNDSRIRALHMAAAKKDYVIAQAIMDAGARGNTGSRKHLYPVNIGAWYGDTKMMQIILLGKSPEKQPRKVIIDLSSQRATLYKDGASVYSARVSTGKRGNRTPTGNFVISDKHRHHNSTIYGSSMPYFMRLSCAAFGLHQSNSVPSYPASHGCIRMTYSGARHMFGQCSVGDLVIIQH